MPYSKRDRHFYVKLDNGSTFSLGNFKALMSNTLNKIPVDIPGVQWVLARAIMALGCSRKKETGSTVQST